MAQRIPVIICGKNPAMGAKVIAAVRHRYDVVHFCASVETAIDEIPQVLARGASVTPSSGLGSNLYRSQLEASPTPVAVIVGAGYTEDEFKQARSPEASKVVAWLCADPENHPLSGWSEGPPPVDRIVKRTLEAADKYKLEEGTHAWRFVNCGDGQWKASRARDAVGRGIETTIEYAFSNTYVYDLHPSRRKPKEKHAELFTGGELGSKWSWALWQVDFEMERGEERRIYSKATDAGGNTQTEARS